MQRLKKTQELVGWVNDLLGFDYSGVDELVDGVALVQVFHALYPSAVQLARVNLTAESPHQFEHNFKILQQVFAKVNIDKEFVLSNVLEKKKQELYHLVTWVHGHYLEVMQSRGLANLDYDASGERVKAAAQKKSRGRTADDTSDASGSVASSNTFGSSCVSGKSSSTNYTSSYNKQRAAKYGFSKRALKKEFPVPIPSTPDTPLASTTTSFVSVPSMPEPPAPETISEAEACEVLYAGCLALLATTAVKAPVIMVYSMGTEGQMKPCHRKRKQQHTTRTPRKPPSVKLHPTRRNNMTQADYVTSKGLIPIGFNFLDPTTWSGGSVCKKLVVSAWTQGVHGQGAYDSLDQLNVPPTVSPSVFHVNNFSPHTPATTTHSVSNINASSLFPSFPLNSGSIASEDDFPSVETEPTEAEQIGLDRNPSVE
eukprot:TRINITY_DN9825_c0_g1_i1.p1 TRINITY_DN9825_c0_g1~~TRINITY_DN9825_c0_g1_i1.p1  ORF type:complete len:426 (+),score=135.55 TRINITY_DN9825_c0_g1_i1:170-1447(+)